MLKKSFLFLLITVSTLLSQHKYDFDQFGNEAVDYFSTPFHWDENDFLFLGLSAGLTFGAMQFDDELQEFTQFDRSENSSIPIIAGRLYGEPLAPLLLSSYFLIAGNSNGNSFQKKVGFEIAQSATMALTTTQILKVLFGRERPSRTNDPTNITGLTLWDNDFWSLPSGHTTLAFSISTVLSENSSSDFLKIISYVPALVTAYSRIYENRHWFSDVVLGGIIGYASAKFFVKKHDEKIPIESAPAPLIRLTIPIN